MSGLAWVGEWAGQLAEVADHVLSKVPEGGEWDVLRGFLGNMAALLRRGDLRSGARAVYQVLPYIQRGLASVEKTVSLSSSCDITETVCQHFLVDEEARRELGLFMAALREKVLTLRTKVEGFAGALDAALEAALAEARPVGLLLSLRLAFAMNRISALACTCSRDLQQARGMLDALDTHVAGKSLLAAALAALSFIGGLVFSVSGNLPVSAACFTAATASRKSAKGLAEYRRELAALDLEHRQLERELHEWRQRFRAEQTNFVLLVGLQRGLLLLLVLAGAFALLGRTAHFGVFALLVLYLVVRSEESNALRYYAGLGLAALAMLAEYDRQHGLLVFNLGACVALGLNALGLIDL